MGVKEQFEQFYRKNYGRHKTTIRRTIKDVDTVEDIVSQAYLTAYEKLDQFDPKKGNMMVWFNTILFNTMRDEQRRFKRQPQMEGLCEEQPYEPQIRDMGVNLERVIDNYKCNETSRKVIYLTYVRGYTSREAANVTGVSATNARTICSRFRQEITSG